MRWFSLVLSAALGVTALADQPTATFSSFNDWLGSETRGVRIDADGRLRLAPNLRRVGQLPEGVIWAAVPDGSGGAYLSAGTDGKLFHYVAGQMKPLAQVKGGIVFAMARLGQDLVVAPTGEGKLFRVTPGGDVKPFADIDARIVWALATEGDAVLVAGGSEKGAALVQAREGSSRRLAELSDETAFTAMVSDGQGGWYLGSHGRGLVLRYSRQGDRLETLMDTPFEEVRALAVADGQLYIGADNGLTPKFATGQLERREGYLQAETATAARSAVLRMDRERVPEVLWQSAQSQVYALTAWKGQLLVATGNRSRIFSLPLGKGRDADSFAPFAVVQELGTAQATAFLPSGGDLLVVGSNPAELHLLSEAQATEGTLESRILKGAPIADWGRAYLDAETPTGTSVELQFRTGSTEAPDATWSAWTPPLRSGERPALPPSRFAQFRLRLGSTRGGASPIVETVSLHWAHRNLSPVWEGVDLMPPGLVITRNAPPDDIGIERVPLETQKLIPALGYMGAEKRSFRRGGQSFVFRVNDPNGDTLRFSISLVPDRGAPIPLEKDWKERFFSFDTLPVPDGRYRLEVVASDAPTAAFNTVLTSTWRTAPFLVDHTPPAISDLSAALEGDSIRVRFLARDETGMLKEAAVSADGERWLQIVPEDRVFDQKEERFDVLVPRDAVRGSRVLVRVVDQHNNEQTAAVTIGAVPAKR
ncbi:MAG: repeat protein [Holophagaceae bacterium]|nr:repeat protein [Holophagaceae bacterium]